MNIEEKEAIEWLKRIITLNKKDGIENSYAEIVLNLIEKQSKEIEKLKAEKDKYYYEWKHLEANMINKIKAKIEELEKEKNIPHEMDFKAFYRIEDLKNIEIKVMQSLLEKE